MIEITTGILLNPGSLKAFHSLHSSQNDKLITKFQEEKMLNKAKAFNPHSTGIESGEVFINESFCHY